MLLENNQQGKQINAIMMLYIHTNHAVKKFKLVVSIHSLLCQGNLFVENSVNLLIVNKNGSHNYLILQL